MKTERLVLRPYQASDYDAWVDAFIAKLPAQNPYDQGPRKRWRLTRARFNRMRSIQNRFARQDEAYLWVVFEKTTEKILGWVDLYVFMRGDSQSANFGYFLHNNHWGQGFGQEAASAAAIASFRHLGLHRLEATIASDNRRSIKLARAIGFRKEGVRRKGDWREGKWQDIVVYSATPDDFGLPSKAPKFGLF